MIRITKALAVAAVALMTLPSIASAIDISIAQVTGAGAGGTLLPGETVTFDLVLSDNTDDVFGLGVNVTGYDPIADLEGNYDGNIQFQSGSSVGSVLGTNIGGSILESINAAPGTSPTENFFVSQFDPQAYTTTLFEGARTQAVLTGSGADDIGLGGTPVGSGDIHFQVTFVNVPSSIAVADLVLSFELDVIGAGGSILPSGGATFALTAVPEPGTALLMGLGLAGLAARRR